MTDTITASQNGAQPDVPAEPLPPATINLDTLEREGGVPDPFSFEHHGRRYTLLDPKEVDWQDLISALTNPYVFFKVTLPEEDHDTFFTAKMPSWKLNRLIDKYIEYHGLPSLGESAALPR